MAETANIFEAGRDLLGHPSGTTVASRRRQPQMTMVRLTDPQRAVLIQAFPAVAHLALGALVFGQFLRQQPFSIPLALAGVAAWIAFVSAAVVLAGRKQ